MTPHPIVDVAAHALVTRGENLEFNPQGLELVRQRLTGLEPKVARHALVLLSLFAKYVDEELGYPQVAAELMAVLDKAAESYLTADQERRVAKTGQLADKVGSKFAEFMGKTEPGEDEEKLSDEPAIKLPIPKNIRG